MRTKAKVEHAAREQHDAHQPPTRSPQACDIVAVGKRRDGGTRFWCRQHKADATAKYGIQADKCRAAHILPIDTSDTFDLSLDAYEGGVALWGAVPPVYDTTALPLDRGIHLHARLTAEGGKEIDQTFRAVRLSGNNLPEQGLMIHELDAIYYMVTSVFGYEMKYVTCTHCGYPHLDRDWFSVHPHRTHLCAGCGRHFRDQETAIGNPICAIRAACNARKQASRLSKKKLTIHQSKFPGGIQVWGSNLAFLWTSRHPEAEGIHVHAFRSAKSEPDIDETFGQVIIDGVQLSSPSVKCRRIDRRSSFTVVQDHVNRSSTRRAS